MRPNSTLFLALLILCPTFAWAQAQPQTIVPYRDGNPDGSNVAVAVDPTKNVLDLVTAAIKRIDDINILDVKIIDERFKAEDKTIELQDRITKLLAEHNADNIKHNEDMIKLRSDYQMRADDKESERINAIIISDRSAAKNEVDRSQKAVDTVATLQTATAETLRSAVATTAAGIATQFAQTTSALVERIAALEKAQYTGAGRSTVADPQVEALRLQVEVLSRAQAQGSGKVEGYGSSWAIVLGVGSLIGVLIAIAGLVIVISTRKHPLRTTR